MKKPDGTPPTPEEFEAALQEVLRIGKKVGTPVGLHVFSIEDVKRRIGEGWQFIAMNSELKFMTTEAQNVLEALGMKKAGDLARY